MPLVNRPFWHLPAYYVPTTANTILVLDAAGEKAAFLFGAPKAGAIAKVTFRLGTVTTGRTLKLSLQDVDPATGDPDGVADQSGTVGVADTDDNVFKTVTLGATRSVGRGEVVACVIEFDDLVGNLQIACGNQIRVGNAYSDLFTTAWAKQSRTPVLVLEYDDGSIASPFGCLAGPHATRTFNNTSTPDEIALRFRLPFPVRCAGLSFLGTLSGDCELVLYQGTSPLATLSLDKDLRSGGEEFGGFFANSVDLAANTVYRASVKPTTTTNLSLQLTDVAEAAHMGALPGGAELYWSERTDGGSWSDFTTRRPAIWLLCEAADDGAGAGGLLRHPGMVGGALA